MNQTLPTFTATYRAVTRPVDVTLAVGVALLLVQMASGFAYHGVTHVSYLGDLLFALLTALCIRLVQRRLAAADVEPVISWPATLACASFIFVTLTIWLALVLKPLDALPGVALVSAIGKALLLGLLILLRIRIVLNLTSTVVQHAYVLSPPAAVVVSFAAAIAFGTLLLSLPEAKPGPGATPVLDALFTSTSATCVTGLIVRDTPVDFSRFGLVTILLLIQAGGLGIMTLGGVFSAAFSQKVSLHQRLLAHDTLIIQERGRLTDTLRGVASYTFLCEAVGALILFLRWWSIGEAPLRAFHLAVFHSISAFCNAGFSLFSTSLENYHADYWITLTITLLIIVGGIGFPVVLDLQGYWWRRCQGLRARLSLHTRLALITTAALLLIGFVGFLILEANATLQPLSWSGRLGAAWFQAVTPRTAGYNTVPMAGLTDATKFLMVLLMFVGASPGSTGGGIKTTTLATLAALSRAMIHGHSGVHVLGRDIPEAVRHRAIAIIILFGMSVLVWTFTLAVTERGSFIDILFETVSAFGTVGLSIGLTRGLTAFGKLALTLAMYMGRVGPLTIALALAARHRPPEMRHPEEPVMVG